ncbi:MAG: class I SAM-dependent methyltransferase [bacterium]|nr:class I SAM-dependent methyltransferase [bacterium]
MLRNIIRKTNFTEALKKRAIRLGNLVRRSESLSESKKKWNELAKKNARYFVLTNYGENISEDIFSKEGQRDYENHIASDEIIKEKIPDSQIACALEIGCGIGRTTEFIARDFGDVYGIDISEEMIAAAEERLAGLSNIKFVATDGITIPFPDNMFDLIFSFIVFQHMPNKETVERNINEVARTLKPGGIAKIQLRGVPVSKSNWFYGPAFTEDDVLKLLRNRQLNLIKTEGADKKYFWIWLAKEN